MTSTTANEPCISVVTELRTGETASAADMDFLLRLGLMEGYLMSSHDLLLAHQGALAPPHFAHPVRERYDDVDDVSDYLAQRSSQGSIHNWSSCKQPLRSRRMRRTPKHR